VRIWLVRDLDPLPIDGPERRLMRSGLLAQALADRGHDVTWFTSSFDHYRKRNRPLRGRIEAGSNLALEVLPGRGYRHNISPARVVHNREFARAFRAAAMTLPPPDVVVADLPTTEGAQAGVEIARQFGVPSVVSIRDLWPDFFVPLLPPYLRYLAQPMIAMLDKQARYACRHATALVGISDGYLRWGQIKGEGRDTTHDRVFPLGYSPHIPDAASIAGSGPALSMPPDSHIVAFAGSWGATSDLRLVYEAAGRLVHREDIHFVLAGDHARYPGLADSLRGLPNVTLTGWLGVESLAALLERATLGLLPYVANAPQGLPNKVFEYMAYGTYQISTIGGELGEFLERTGAGVAVPEATGEQLADCISALADDPAIAARRPERKAFFASHFRADAIHAAMGEHIEDVVRTVPGEST